MSIPVIYSDEFLDHYTGRSHPERPARLTAIVNALKIVPWAQEINWQLPTPVIQRPLLKPLLQEIHSQEYIQKVQTISLEGGGRLDGDTFISPRSYDVALLAVSAWLDGVDYAVNAGNSAFVLARPPGHHAERDYGMGFCLFSNAAIAANYALKQWGISRVAILDWDVHHGNGTQSIVETNSQLAYCSLHQYPAYPGTGKAHDRGIYDNILNIPMIPGSAIAEYKIAFEQKVIPFLREFQPDLLIISAGYDGNAADRLASIELQPPDFGVFTDYCVQITRKIVFGLEGGYDLPTLAESVLATIESCLSQSPGRPPLYRRG